MIFLQLYKVFLESRIIAEKVSILLFKKFAHVNDD